MFRWRSLAALLIVALIGLAPALAEARAGGSYRSGGGSSYTSQGSLGSRTYDQPMQRSITPQTPSTAPSAAASGYAGYGNSHPFWSGLAGGLFGGWLGSMLFPHWGMGYGGGFGSVLGSVFSWILIIGLLFFGYRMLMRRFGPVTAPDIAPMRYSGGGGFQRAASPGGGRGAPLAIAQADYQAYEAILKHVQDAWSRGDIAGLRPYVTPEMLSYFGEELAENQSQGVVNHVEQIELVRGDLREAWDEGRLQYASCNLRWRALDYTVRADARPGDPGAVVEGDAQHPSEAAELWTFARSPGGHWLLSAIQQT